MMRSRYEPIPVGSGQTRRSLPKFPQNSELVHDESNAELLKALLPALRKYDCLRFAETKPRRSPWVRAFCDLNHPAGPWGHFRNTPDIGSNRRYKFKSYQVPTIFAQLEKYKGRNDIHLELRSALRDYFSKEGWYKDFMSSAEKIASNEINKPLGERASLEVFIIDAAGAGGNVETGGSTGRDGNQPSLRPLGRSLYPGSATEAREPDLGVDDDHTADVAHPCTEAETTVGATLGTAPPPPLPQQPQDESIINIAELRANIEVLREIAQDAGFPVPDKLERDELEYIVSQIMQGQVPVLPQQPEQQQQQQEQPSPPSPRGHATPDHHLNENSLVSHLPQRKAKLGRWTLTQSTITTSPEPRGKGKRKREHVFGRVTRSTCRMIDKEALEEDDDDDDDGDDKSQSRRRRRRASSFSEPEDEAKEESDLKPGCSRGSSHPVSPESSQKEKGECDFGESQHSPGEEGSQAGTGATKQNATSSQSSEASRAGPDSPTASTVESPQAEERLNVAMVTPEQPCATPATSSAIVKSGAAKEKIETQRTQLWGMLERRKHEGKGSGDLSTKIEKQIDKLDSELLEIILST